MNDDLAELRVWFSRPDRYQAIDPKRAIWLDDDNIIALSKDARFMEVFRQVKTL